MASSFYEPAQTLPFELYPALLDHAPLGICIMDLEGRIQYANHRAERIIGIPKDEMIAVLMANLIHQEDVERMTAETMGLVLGHQDSVYVEKRFPQKRGDVIWTKAHITLIKDTEGEPQLVMCMMEDITQEKNLRKKLTQQEEIYRALFEWSTDAIYIVDMAGIMIDVNEATCKLLGYTREELIGTKFLDLHPADPATHADARQGLEHLQRNGHSRGETQLLTRSGEILYGEIRAKLVKVQDQTVIQGIFRDHTEKRKVELAHQQTVNEYQILFEQSGDGLGLIDLQGRFLVVNQRLCEIFEHTKEEFEQLSIPDTHPPSEEALAICGTAMAKTMERGQAAFENIFLTKSGKHLFGEVRTSITRWKGEQVVLAIFRDITQQKEAENALRKSEAHFKALFDQSVDGVAICDTQGKIRSGNQALEEIMGYQLAEIQSIHPSRILQLDQKWEDLVAAVLVDIRQDGGAQREVSVKTHTGEIRICDFQMSPIWVDNEPLIQVIVRDITSKKKAIRDLETTKLVVETAEIGVFEWNLLEGEHLQLDENSNLIFGLDPAVSSRPLQEFIDLIHSDDRERVVTQLHHAIDQAENRRVSYRIIRKDDQAERWIRERWMFETNSEGKVTNLRGVVWDETFQREMQETAIQKVKLEAQNEELKEFTYIASHDLQSPLRTISNYVKLMEEDYGDLLDQEGKFFLQTIASGTERMTHLIRDLLAYSRLGKDRIVEPVDTTEMLAEIQQDLAHDITAANALIQLGNLPVIYGYRLEMRMLLQNLISNALKFRSPTRQLQLDINIQPEGANWLIAVSDNGIGIKPAFFEQIFQVFQRLHHQRDYEGTGIGLAHCAKIAALHQGRIWVKSMYGEGSTFYVAIPRDLK